MSHQGSQNFRTQNFRRQSFRYSRRRRRRPRRRRLPSDPVVSPRPFRLRRSRKQSRKLAAAGLSTSPPERLGCSTMPERGESGGGEAKTRGGERKEKLLSAAAARTEGGAKLRQTVKNFPGLVLLLSPAQFFVCTPPSLSTSPHYFLRPRLNFFRESGSGGKEQLFSLTLSPFSMSGSPRRSGRWSRLRWKQPLPPPRPQHCLQEPPRGSDRKNPVKQ